MDTAAEDLAAPDRWSYNVMHRIVVSAALAVMFIVAACGSATAPSPSPSAPSSPAPAPSEPAPASPTPEPSVAPPSEEPSDAPTEAPAEATAQEQYLLDGVLRGAQDCAPVRDDLPEGAVAGIECAADDPAVAQVGFYLFADEAAMLEAYFARMDAEGVPESGGGNQDTPGNPTLWGER